jgi:amino acid adenylation domain-containing protein
MKMKNKREEIAIAASRLLKEQEYWMRKLSGELVKTGFPYDCGDRNQEPGTPGFDTVEMEFPAEHYSKMMRLCAGSDSRLHMVLTAGLILTLYKYTGCEDIIVGTSIDKQEMEGEFINTVLALRNRVEPGMTFKELLLQVRETVVGAMENRNYPIDTLVYDLKLPGSPGEFPLFDIAILLENIHSREYLSQIEIDMVFCFLKTANGLQGRVEFNAMLYKKAFIEKIITHLISVIGEALLDVNSSVSGIEMLSEEEKKQLLSGFNNPGGEFPARRLLHQWAQEEAEKRPGNTVLVFEDLQLTGSEVDERADRLAGYLKEKGITSDMPAAMMLDISPEAVLGILAILKAGGAFLPIDPQYPEGHIDYMLADSRAKVLLVGPGTRDKAAAPPIEIIDIGSPLSFSTLTSARTNRANSTDLAYVIYTSGSTGRPKAVMVQHNNIVNQMYGLINRYDFHQTMHHVLMAPFTFDPSVQQVFLPLSTGGKLHLAPACIKLDSRRLLEFILRHRLEVFNTVPSLMRALVNQARESNTSLPLVFKYIILAGEVFSMKLYRELQEVFAVEKVINIYGPTEAAINTTLFECSSGTGLSPVIPIGKPLFNYKVFILSKHGELLPVGIPGELCISGRGLARGYLNSPGLTAEKFDQDLWDYQDYRDKKKNENNEKFFRGSRGAILQKSPPGRRRLYKTGDLARWQPDGNIEFLGRMDHQVKIRGIRVETGEIEYQLRKHPKIKEAVVLARPDKQQNTSLYAYISTVSPVNQAGEKDRPVTEPGLSAAQLRRFLEDRLPVSVIPSYFIPVEKIPLTPNGKIDRKALERLEIKSDQAVGYTAPRNRTEEILVDIWQEVLEIEKIGIKESFLSIGGDSIKSLHLLNDVNREFNLDFQVADLYENDTVESFASLITAAQTNHPSTGNKEHEYGEYVDRIEKLKDKFMKEFEPNK